MHVNRKLVALIALGISVGIIVLQNTESVETHVLFFSFSMPRAVLLFVCAVIGFVLKRDVDINHEGSELLETNI